MLRYALRRLLLLPLSLFLLSLACFGLRQITPGDPVQRLLPAGDTQRAVTDPAAYDRSYRRAATALGLDRPVFYFTLRNGALPDTLHRVARPGERAMLRALTLHSGNWPAVQNYYRELRALAYAPDTPEGPRTETRAVLLRLLLQDDAGRTERTLATLANDPATASLQQVFPALQSPDNRAALLLPAFKWNGTDNQYHHWLASLLSGNLGNSLENRRPVGEEILRAAKWTALINGFALLLVYLIAIPQGLYAAGYRGSWFDRLSTTGLFILFGIPSFWLATLMANFLTTPAFGLDLFPSMGVGTVPEGASLFTLLRVRAGHLFLPVVCMAYPSWAYVSRHLRSSAVTELDRAYVKTARLKGLSRSAILWRHVFRNASFPIITLLAGVFPALLAGSILIERIFDIPGMGQLLFNAARNGDWPVVIPLVLFNGILTALGLLLADLGYALADPRVRLGGAKKSLM